MSEEMSRLLRVHVEVGLRLLHADENLQLALVVLEGVIDTFDRGMLLGLVAQVHVTQIILRVVQAVFDLILDFGKARILRVPVVDADVLAQMTLRSHHHELA